MRLAAALILAIAAITACKERAPESRSPSLGEPRSGEAQPAPAKCDPAQPRVCVGDKVVECVGTKPGKTLEECKAGCRSGTCTSTCAVKGVELVYVVDSDHNLLSFDPQRLPGEPFHMIGKLTCETAGQPFSMAVANDGIAWVLYTTGRIYRVSILDAHCTKAGDPDDGPDTFGMGFAADGPVSEKLYLAGNDSSQQLAVLDTTSPSPQWQPVATIAADQQRNPELTGTADGALFGYFPDEVSGGFVQQIDPKTGKVIGARMKLAAGPGEIEAYAFAHWGGVFYVFTTINHTNIVHAIHRKTGKYELVLPRIPYEVVGAGVSTCAPELEREPAQ